MTTSSLGIDVGATPDDDKHLLYVEGNNEYSFDRSVLKELVSNLKIQVRHFHGCLGLRAAATAFHDTSPNHYFIIDRDFCDNEKVEKSWQIFEDDSRPNLLIWRSREIENYFLDPDYLALSSYTSASVEEIRVSILQCVQQRVFLDAANLVLMGTVDKERRPGVEKLRDPQICGTAEIATELVAKHPYWNHHKRHTG
jgi:hypothetical protein